MDRHKIVNIISSCRRQKGVRQADLCRGICSVASYSRIESGEAVIPLVMAQTFLERLGTDPGQLEQLLEGEDYGCHQKRQDIEAALRDGQAAQAEQLLAAYKEAAGEDKLEIQYVKYCQARIGRLRMRQDASLDLEARGQLAGETERLLQEAESLTIPKRGRGMLLSRVELGILLAETEGRHARRRRDFDGTIRRLDAQVHIAVLLAQHAHLHAVDGDDLARDQRVRRSGASCERTGAGEVAKRHTRYCQWPRGQQRHADLI